MEFKIGFPYGWIILWRKTEKEKRKSISVLSPSFRGQVRAQSVVDTDDGNALGLETHSITQKPSGTLKDSLQKRAVLGTSLKYLLPGKKCQVEI